MEELFLKMNGEFIPIDSKMVEKYKLKKDMLSPFSRYPIVDKSGEFNNPEDKKMKDEEIEKDFPGLDDIDDGSKFETSEIIDISQGVDSDTGDAQ
ncbi:MAG: hypothetical protein Q8865_03865 [Bacillota bacterium]|nr:hypothetical protein [Bacillota bacterium]